MRHRVSGKKFGRNTKQRKSLFKGLAASLVEHGQIKTTEVKGKELKSTIDKLIARAHRGTLASRRLIEAFFNKKDLTNKLFDQIAPALKKGQGGNSRIVKLGRRRGDNTMMVRVEIVGIETATKEVAPVKATKKAETKTKAKSSLPQIRPDMSKIPGANVNKQGSKLTQRTTSK